MLNALWIVVPGLLFVVWCLRSDSSEWRTVARDLQSENKRLLDKRDELQSKVDDYRAENRSLIKQLHELTDKWESLTGYADELREPSEA